MCTHEGRRAGCQCPGSRMERFMEPCLLLLLGQQASHGYELMERLVAAGLLLAEEPDPGLIYRTLRRLEDSGIVSSIWQTGGVGPAKRQYTLTEAGYDYLSVWAGNIKSNRDRLTHFLTTYEELSKHDENGRVRKPHPGSSEERGG